MISTLVAYAIVRWSQAAGNPLVVCANQGFASIVDNSTGTGAPTGEILYVPDNTIPDFPILSRVAQVPTAPLTTPQLMVEILPLSKADVASALDLVTWTADVLTSPPASVAPGTIVYPTDPITGAPRLVNILSVQTYGQVAAVPVGTVNGKFDYVISVTLVQLGG